MKGDAEDHGQDMVEDVENSFELPARLTQEVDFQMQAMEVDCDASSYPVKSDFVERRFNANCYLPRIRVDVDSGCLAQDSGASRRRHPP